MARGSLTIQRISPHYIPSFPENPDTSTKIAIIMPQSGSSEKGGVGFTWEGREEGNLG